MPAPGDQYNNVLANPFTDRPTRMFEYTAQEIATLQSRLDKQLGPEYISSRPGQGGQKVHYVSGEKVIALANEVFGFNGWSSAIRDVTIDFVDEDARTMKISLGLSVIVRITLRDGTFHEDVGYGHIENCKGKAAAFEKCKKEGATDGLKRALRTFGNVLGNCIRDRDYLARVAKMKAGPVRFDEAALHRHGDFVKKEAAAEVVKTEMPSDSVDELLAEFDEADFGVTNEDEVGMDDTWKQLSHTDKQPQTAPNVHNGPNRPPMPPAQQFSRPTGRPARTTSPKHPKPRTKAHDQVPGRTRTGRPVRTSSDPRRTKPPGAVGSQPSGEPGPGRPDGPDGLLLGQGRQPAPDAGALPGSENAPLPVPQGQMAFNPKAESPSIRKTPGIDHSSSKPLARNGQHVAPTSSQQQGGGAAGPNQNHGPPTPGGGGGGGNGNGNSNSNFVPPGAAAGRPSAPQPGVGRSGMGGAQFDHARRIGAPGAAGSPLANRNSYRPPTMKRPLPGEVVAGAGSGMGGGSGPGRPALADVSVNGPSGGSPNGAVPDIKRQKMT